MNEIWKPVVGFEGLYEVSNLGNIKSLNYCRTGQKKILKCLRHISGYLQISLRKNNQSYKITIHKIVATAFVENPNNYTEINHKDEDKTNNSANNLEWCTHKDNCNYGSRTERTIRTRNEKGSLSAERTVRQYTLDGKLVGEYRSQSEASRKFGIKASDISKCTHRKVKSVKGFVWRFIGDTFDYDKKTSAKCVIQYTLDGNFIKEYKSITDAQLATGVTGGNISGCCLHKQKTAGGFIWKYKNENGENRIDRC